MSKSSSPFPPAPSSLKDAFDLSGRVGVITGGAGLLGVKHAEAIAEMGGTAVLLDVDGAAAEAAAGEIREAYGATAVGMEGDITDEAAMDRVHKEITERFERVHILINNAANNPKVEGEGEKDLSRLENFPMDVWHRDIAVGLTGAFICSRLFGQSMADQGGGVILNIASDLGLIAPDQRLYGKDGLPPDRQPVKPVTYSVVKSGLLGLTRYLATYWTDSGVRCNALLPGGVETNQDDDFVKRLSDLIPMGRMAGVDDYKGAVAFLVSDASAYMTGAILSIDGGRTAW